MDAMGEAGPYRLLAELGRDDTGRVFVARGPDGELYAVKLVHDRLVSDEFRTRLRRAIRKPPQFAGLLPVVAGDADAAVPWVAVTAPAGVPLAAAPTLHDSGAPWLLAGVASALKGVHRNGLAHGELSAATVWLTAAGPKVVDFGIARAADERVPTDDIHALGVLVETTVTGAAWGRRKRLPKRLRGLAAACRAADPGARPTASRLLKAVDIEDHQRRWPFDLVDLLDAGEPGWLGVLAGGSPYAAERAGRARRAARTRRARTRTTRPRRTTARRRAAPDPAAPRPAPRPPSRLTRADRGLVTAVAVFSGWAAGQLAFGFTGTTGLPGHDELLEYGVVQAHSAWLTSGLVLGVLSALLVWLTVDTAGTRFLVLIVAALTAAPVVIGLVVVLTGMDVGVVSIGRNELSYVGQLFAILLGIPLFFALDRLFPRNTALARVGGFLVVSVAFATVPFCVGVGWMGVVLGGVVRIDVVSVLAGTGAAVITYRRVRSARSRTAAGRRARVSG